MARIKVCIAAVVCVVGFFVVLSCSKPLNVLSFECKNSGAYLVDVVHWVWTQGKEDTTHFWGNDPQDATIAATAYYYQPGDGMAHYSGDYAAHLDKYQITWPSGSGLPKTTGGLDVIVPSAAARSRGVSFDIVVIPATNFDTVAALSALWGDPETHQYAGELDVTGTVKVSGTDLATGEDVSGEFQIATYLADYADPNKLP